jgi:threonine-phosphate decarboxylase
VSKFFASPGLRLGYAVTGNQDLLKKINTRKNPWTINSLAAIAGELMFSDTEYIEQTKALIHQERTRIYEELKTWNSVKVYSPTANFILVKSLNPKVTADDLFDHAIRKGLMIRNCSTFPFLDNSFFRFCFMSPEKNTELLNCLKELFDAYSSKY